MSVSPDKLESPARIGFTAVTAADNSTPASALGSDPWSNLFYRRGRASPESTLQNYADELNRKFPVLAIPDRIALIHAVAGEQPIIATTSGGTQSGVLLSQIHASGNGQSNSELGVRIRKMPIVFIDTGDLFKETKEYLSLLKNEWKLSLAVFKHGLTNAELQYNIDIRTDLKRDEAFDDLTKIRPMQEILSRYNARIWIAGNRRDQSTGRADTPFAHVENGILKVFPLADVTTSQVELLFHEFNIPSHPLAGVYKSIGNRSDTAAALPGGSERSGRFLGSGREECGLHTRWAQQGSVFIADGDTYIPAPNFPLINSPLEES